MHTIREEILETTLPRRELIRAGAIGVAALGFGGLAPLAEALQAQASTTATNEREYRQRQLALGTLSFKSAQLGQRKATNPAAKQFAGFEAAEQAATAAVLTDLNTPVLPMDQQATEILRQHESTEGAAFDRVFANAQLQVHQMLRDLNQSFLTNSKGNGVAERHARHLATLSLPTIFEHIAHTTALVATVGS